MHPDDQANYQMRYRARLARYGYAPESLGWGHGGRQEIRFSVLAEGLLANPNTSVLDVGCGFADLYDYLVARGWSGSYTGLDLVPELLDVARARHPQLELHAGDLASFASGKTTYDYVLASGIFNARLQQMTNEAHIEASLGHMLALARVAVCADFMSTWVDFQHPEAWHTDPVWLLQIARRLSRRLELRCDYMPFEFALTLYRDDSCTARQVFSDFRPCAES
ncbi:MAG: class I SAM-dependent methyltransferase [Candidatus Melainabacteria bacterium HGW-Melainabacteria-1]|nr:MAG: class I SAM-dependent methyltransferase [Candidatus Melainabacteria bacterium HGW-Melainabacteria-1]